MESTRRHSPHFRLPPQAPSHHASQRSAPSRRVWVPELHYACKTGRVDKVRELLRCLVLNPDARDALGRNPLWYAFHTALNLKKPGPLRLLIACTHISDWRLRSRTPSGDEIETHLLNHSYSKRQQLPGGLMREMVKSAAIPINEVDQQGHCLLDRMLDKNAKFDWTLFNEVLARPDTVPAAHTIATALKEHWYPIAERLLEHPKADLSPCGDSDVVFEALLNTIQEAPDGQQNSLVTSYFNNPTSSAITVTPDGSHFNRLELFNDWDHQAWIRDVLQKLRPEALKRLCAPLVKEGHVDCKDLYLENPHHVCAALLVAEPGYQPDLLQHISNILPPEGEEISDWWYEDASQQYRCSLLAITLNQIRPQNTPLHEWLGHLGLGPRGIHALIQALPDQTRSSSLSLIQKQTSQLLLQHSAAHYTAKAAALKDTSDPTLVKQAEVARAALALRSLRMLTPFGESDVAQLCTAITEYLTWTSRIQAAQPGASSSHEVTTIEELRDTDIVSLLMLMVPNSEKSDVNGYLNAQLGAEPMPLLEALELTSGSDLEQKLGVDLNDFQYPIADDRREGLFALLREHYSAKRLGIMET